MALSRISSDGSNDKVVFVLNRRVADVMVVRGAVSGDVMGDILVVGDVINNDDLGGIFVDDENANDDLRDLDIITASIITVYIEPQKTPLCFKYVAAMLEKW